MKLLSKKDRKKVKIVLALQKEEKLKKQNETLKEILFNYEKKLDN